MAKSLNTVHLSDENGEVHSFGPADDLPDWAVKQLTESWPADRDDLWAEAPKGGAAPKQAQKPADKADPNK